MEINEDHILYHVAEHIQELENANKNQASTIAVQYDEMVRLNGIIRDISPVRQRIIGAAFTVAGMAKVGTKIVIDYKFGGEWENDRAFDCSSYTQFIYLKAASIVIPRTSVNQSKSGTDVTANPQPADLLFFDTNKDGIVNHVGIYLGNGMMIHTAKVGESIVVNDWKERYKTLVTARSFI